ncbi:MAG TPA: nuclear transport factor 2 family protein [Thermoanaerobaculia bacterium]|nr:nuclear transport factor 2 family protein [Thermoanaerobaculia bacterium]
MKMMKTLSLVLFVSALPAIAQTAAEPHHEIHQALRDLRGRLLVAMNKNDIDGILRELHPNVIVTWQNAEVSRGPQGVRAYLERMTKSPNHVVLGYHADLNVDELTTLYGENTGVAYGSSVEQFDLRGGQKFTLRGRWSATLVNENGRWLIASVHASSNLFDNPLLDSTKKAMYIAVPVAALIALLIGLFLGRRTARTA